MPENPNRPTSTKTLILLGVVVGLAIAVASFMSGADAGTGKRFGGMAQAAIGLALLVGGGWAALRRKS